MKITTDRKLMLVLSTALILFTISGAMIGRVVAVEGTYSYLKLFNEALYLIVHNYVQPVQIDVLMEGAYRGMLESLDPANEYLAPARYERAYRGESDGPASVGTNLSKRRGYIIVVSVAPGSPAAEGGLQTGDVLVSIDGRSTRQLGVWEATQALSGKPGSKTTINLSPVDSAGRKTVTLVRKVIASPPPSSSMEPGAIGIVRISSLREGDARRVDQAISSLKRRGATRLLVDLRGCSSDALAEAIGTASLFVHDGSIVSISDRYEGDKSFRADGRRQAWDGPVAVLVDAGTAGVCEVLAAALRDDRDAPVLGQRTWGEGAVRKLLPLQHGDGVLLATGKYLSPAGKEWHGQGLQPDVPIDGRLTDAGDPQQKKAVEYLRGQALSVERKAA
jgi:carboxyl-terminal processing protease